MRLVARRKTLRRPHQEKKWIAGTKQQARLRSDNPQDRTAAENFGGFLLLRAIAFSDIGHSERRYY
jgi:hypothetical protein